MISAITRPIPKPPSNPVVPKLSTPISGITVKPIITIIKWIMLKPDITFHPFSIKFYLTWLIFNLFDFILYDIILVGKVPFACEFTI